MESIVSLTIFAAIAAFTPGPNNIMIMSSGLNHGVRRSLPHFLGICLGFPSMILAIGFGLGYLFSRYPVMHSAIQVIGLIYLFYLAWLIASSAPSKLNIKSAPPLTFMQAALFQWINPKAWIMATSALAAYTTVGQNIAPQVLTVAVVFMLLALPSCGVWLVFGSALQKVLKNPSQQHYFNLTMSALLIISMLPIIVDVISTLVANIKYI